MKQKTNSAQISKSNETRFFLRTHCRKKDLRFGTIYCFVLILMSFAIFSLVNSQSKIFDLFERKFSSHLENHFCFASRERATCWYWDLIQWGTEYTFRFTKHTSSSCCCETLCNACFPLRWWEKSLWAEKYCSGEKLESFHNLQPQTGFADILHVVAHRLHNVFGSFVFESQKIFFFFILRLNPVE